MRENSRFKYDREYYLSDCDGYIQFNNSKGKVMGKRLKKIFDLTCLRPGMKIMDIGCGRGELVLHIASQKNQVWGIDSSASAINICRDTLNFWEQQYPDIKNYARFLKCDAGRLNFDEEFFDVIILSDIVEHLEKNQFKIILKRIRRMLKKNARIIIHTSPNKFYLSFSGLLFFFISAILAATGSRSQQKIIPPNIRNRLPGGLAKDVHLNEQSSYGLKHILRKTGLKTEKIWFELNPHYIDRLFSDPRGFKWTNTLRKIIPFKHLFYADIYCIAIKPS